jgi:hypothetical protein
MSNLYGIESEADCRAKIDELLEMCLRARQAMNKETMAVLKGRLKECYKMGDGNRRSDRMSRFESTYFWPAVQDAYLKAPKLHARMTWQDGLDQIEFYLRHYRQMLPK